MRHLHITSNDIDIVVPNKLQSVLPKGRYAESVQDLMLTKKVSNFLINFSLMGQIVNPYGFASDSD